MNSARYLHNFRYIIVFPKLYWRGDPPLIFHRRHVVEQEFPFSFSIYMYLKKKTVQIDNGAATNSIIP